MKLIRWMHDGPALELEAMTRLPPSPRTATRPGAPDLAALYAQYTDNARRHLRRFGASEQDLDDLLQEVFLVLHAKHQGLQDAGALDAWLREVCRRIAAGDRRRAHRRREIAFGEPPETATDGSFDQTLEQGEQEERLHLALEQLDEQSRDLVALHELGRLPLVDVAELVDADRKTVSKRLGMALRRLTALVRSDSLDMPSPPAQRETRPSAPPRAGDAFRVLCRSSALNMGLVGSVVIAVWPGAATMDALELLDVQFARALELCGGGFSYLAVVEASTRPPNLEARQKIVSMLQVHAANIRVYATALQGGAAWIARPIMTGLSLLARPPFPMQYFNGVPAAASWLSEQHPALANASSGAIIDGAEQLRVV
jgi:RNA polymerase sigma-70 factor (ECF subfamily)